MFGDERRAVSPVVGTILLVALVILLASLLAASLGVTSTSFRRPSYERDQPLEARGSGVIVALDHGANEPSVRHRVEFPIRDGTNLDGDSLNSVEVDYLNDSVALSQDERSDIARIGIDDDGDGEIDVDAHGDLEAPSNGGVDVREDGDLLHLELSGNHNLDGGDQVVVVYDAVTNPRRGVYPASVTVNDYPDLSRLGTVRIGA